MINIVVHNGTYHADDLFAVATLKRMLRSRGADSGDINIIRTRDLDEVERGDFVADIGGIYDPSKQRFDHHQEGGAGERDNGIPYAAFGLIWKEYGAEVAGSEDAARAIDERLVQTIDALDNGVDILDETLVDIPHMYLLQNALGSFQPTWNEEGYTMTDAFFRALEFVELILDREITQEKARDTAFRIVAEEYENSGISDDRILLIHDDYPHYGFVEKNPQILFVVKPDREGTKWKVRTVSRSSRSFASRKLLPAEWAGKTGGELAQITGVSDASFVHNKRFIAVADSKEGAIELAKKALND